MDADMSNYPPPDQQYSGAYPVASAAPQSSPESAIQQLQASLGQQAEYNDTPLDEAFGQRVQNNLEQLQNAAQSATQVSEGQLGEQVQQQAGTGISVSTSADQSPRTNRLRKACDSCSIRKVKCDEAGPPCRACSNLDIPCTFERPSRRRGPPNRHAEAIKRRRLEIDSGSGEFMPNNAAEALAALGGGSLQVQQSEFSAESIFPHREIVARLVQDYFTYVHPLTACPHEPMFMNAFQRREDANNKIFVAMLAAMVGALLAAYPKRLRIHCRALNTRADPAENLVQNCIHICTSARGSGYLDRADFDVNTYDAITSYLLGQIYAQRNSLRQAGRYFAEALTILRGCGLQSSQSSAIRQAPLNPLDKDLVHIELAQRLWWRLYMVSKQLQQAKLECPELEWALSGPTPPLPTERDDPYIFTDNFDEQPYGVTSEITGFRIYLNVYQASGDLEAINLVNLADGTPDFTQRRAIIQQTLTNVKQIQNLPAPPSNPYEQLQQYLNPSRPADDEPRQEQRQTQVIVQRAMIEMAILSTRFQTVEAFWRVDDQQKSDEKDDDRVELQLRMKEERADIIKDLIQLLASVSHMMIEFSLDHFAEQYKRLAKTLSERQPARRAKEMPEEVSWITKVINLVERIQRVAREPEGTFSDEYENLQWNEWRAAIEQTPNLAPTE